MNADWDVLGFGAVAVDDLFYVDRYPLPDTKVKVLAEWREGGGQVGTALVAAARLGAEAAYCGVLGDDELSRFTLREFEREGVDCSEVLIRPEAQPIHSTVIVESTTGRRGILGSFAGVAWRQPDEIGEDLVARCRVLFIDHHACAANVRAVELAHRRGIPVVADFERAADPLIAALLPQVDHLIVGIRFAREVTGAVEPEAMVAALAAPGRACTAVTAGERGCWYQASGGQVAHVAAFTVPVVDTTGCGDVFHGAYAALIARGNSVDDAIRAASAAAALKAAHRGGRSGAPTLAAVGRFLAGL